MAIKLHHALLLYYTWGDFSPSLSFSQLSCEIVNAREKERESARALVAYVLLVYSRIWIENVQVNVGVNVDHASSRARSTLFVGRRVDLSVLVHFVYCTPYTVLVCLAVSLRRPEQWTPIYIYFPVVMIWPFWMWIALTKNKLTPGGIKRR